MGAGGLFFAPRGYPHAFMVTSESARILALATPGSRVELIGFASPRAWRSQALQSSLPRVSKMAACRSPWPS